MPINQISHQAGDLAILEAAARIDSAATDDMLVLRIGGDEFALVTGLADMEAVKEISQSVTRRNGQPIVYEGQEIPLSLWSAITTIPGDSLRYSDLFTDMHKVLVDSKK